MEPLNKGHFGDYTNSADLFFVERFSSLGGSKCIVGIIGPPEGGPILFLLSPEVSGTSGTMSIYICQQHGGREVGTKSFGYISVKFIRLLLILSAKGLLDQKSSSKYYFSQ